MMPTMVIITNHARARGAAQHACDIYQPHCSLQSLAVRPSDVAYVWVTPKGEFNIKDSKQYMHSRHRSIESLLDYEDYDYIPVRTKTFMD